MAGARLSALVALLLLFAVSFQHAVLAQETCKEDVLGHSSIIGSKQQGAVMVDHSSLAAKGPITRVSLYYSKDKGCLKAAKAAFGDPPAPGIIGSTAGTTERWLKLEAGEVITKAEYKAGKCIEYLKLSTSKGRSVSAGQVGPVADLMTSAPTEGKGQLLAIKGSSKTIQGKKQGALQHLQLVWGSTKCTKVATQAAAEALVPESGTLSEDSPVLATGPGACKPRVDMCNEKASMNAFTYCVWNAPFSGPSCRGGCCFSSGKCASSSCAISGMGRDVPNMICYGVNSGVGFGGNSNCGGLACKLATPGCTTDAFGGNCVGTVVAVGSKEAVHPESLKVIGAPCLDATPSDTTLDRTGAPASGEEGVYMGKLWTVCDCAEGGTGLPEPAARLLNLTTSRISNFTKNEVMAAFSTFLPQKNVTDEANGKDKVVTLLPSFADMFKFPALSSIDLPSILGDLTGAKGGKDGQSVAAPKLPDLSGLLSHLKPTDGQQQTAAAALQGNAESGSLPNGTKVELMGTGSAPAQEKPPRTLGSLLSLFTKPKNGSAHGAGSSSSTSAPIANNKPEADNASSSTKVKPMTLGSLFGGLRRAGPDNSTATPAAAAPAGNSTRKLDLSPIGALINKFINGPQAAPPAATAAAATTTAVNGTQPAVQSVPAPAQQQPATAAKLQAVPQPSQPAAAAAAPAAAPAASPAPRAPGPATLTVPKSGKLQYVAPTAGNPPPESALDLAPEHTPGDPNDRPKTLAERLREKKAQMGATKTVVDIKDGVSAPTPPEEAPQIRKRFSANVPGLNLPPVRRPSNDPVWVATGMETPMLMLNLQALTNALQAGAGAGAEDLMQFGALLGQLQQVPGGLGALPADVSTALMTLAAEVNRVTSGGAPAAAPATPAAAAAAQPADKAAEKPAAVATSAPAAAEPAEKAAGKPAAAATPAPASAPAAATPADKVADKPTAAAATPAGKGAEKPTAAATSSPAAAAQPADKAAGKPAPAATPAPATAATPAGKGAEKPTAAATPAPAAAAQPADKAAGKPAPAATPAPAAAAQPAKQAADKPAAAPPAPAPTPAPAKSADADKKEQPQPQPQQQQQQPVSASLASMPGSSSSSSKRETSATAPAAAAAAASKEVVKQSAQAATPAAAAAAAAAVPAAGKSVAPESSKDSASQPASAGAASKPAPAAADDKPAAAVASKPASAAAGAAAAAAAGPDKASAAATLPSEQPKAASKQQ